MPTKTRGFLAAAALLVSGASAQAGDHAVFSPELAAPPPLAAAAPAAAPGLPVVEPRARQRRGRGRYARARERRLARATAELSRSVDPTANLRQLTIGTVPAPLPPGREGVGDAVATLETAAPDPQPAAPSPASADAGPRAAAARTLAELLAQHAFENGVPLPLARAVVRIESGGNARASNHGALGLMQIKWATARAVGFTGPALALLVADTNLRFGMKVLAQAYREARGDVCGALMRYQSGRLTRHPSAANRAYCARARALMARD